MSMIYIPSCKYTIQYKEISNRIKNYVKDRFDAEIAGCCKRKLDSITSEDTVIYICNTCAAFFAESTPAKKVISIWELLNDDKQFSYPDYRQKQLTVQDCWRTYDNTAQQNAVREILMKNHCDTIRTPEVVGYCVACVNGINLGGKEAFHLSELVFKR